jgi:hypothetical protein
MWPCWHDLEGTDYSGPGPTPDLAPDVSSTFLPLEEPDDPVAGQVLWLDTSSGQDSPIRRGYQAMSRCDLPGPPPQSRASPALCPLLCMDTTRMSVSGGPACTVIDGLLQHGRPFRTAPSAPIRCNLIWEMPLSSLCTQVWCRSGSFFPRYWMLLDKVRCHRECCRSCTANDGSC